MNQPQSVRSIPLRDGLGGLLAFRSRQLSFLTDSVRVYGDVFGFGVPGLSMIMVNHPGHVQRIMVDNHRNYDKGARLYRTVRPVLRGGLIANPGGESWRVQRKLMQPAFTPESVARFDSAMTSEALSMLLRWEQRYRPGDVLNVTEEMGRLALRIVSRWMFGVDLVEKAGAFQHAFNEANAIMAEFFRFPFPPLSVPIPRHRRLAAAIRAMDDFVSSAIRHRLTAGDEAEVNLLSALLHAVDEDSGRGMSAEQLQHEVLNVVLGSYETTTNTLSWVYYLLARHPDVERRFLAEVDAVLGRRVPTAADLRNLPYTRMIVDETLRMYSPAWQTMRRCYAR